jgi:hypothetical protein
LRAIQSYVDITEQVFCQIERIEAVMRAHLMGTIQKKAAQQAAQEKQTKREDE